MTLVLPGICQVLKITCQDPTQCPTNKQTIHSTLFLLHIAISHERLDIEARQEVEAESLDAAASRSAPRLPSTFGI